MNGGIGENVWEGYLRAFHPGARPREKSPLETNCFEPMLKTGKRGEQEVREERLTNELFVRSIS